MDVLEQEAKTFTKYLAHREASSQAIRLYKVAVEANKSDASDEKLLSFMRKHPHSIGLIDAGLIFHNPTSEARHRLYIMLAILEASTECADLFLPKKRSAYYLLVVAYSGVRAVVRAVLGLLLVKVVA